MKKTLSLLKSFCKDKLTGGKLCITGMVESLALQAMADAATDLQNYIGGLLCVYVPDDEDFSDVSNKIKLFSFEVEE